MKAQQTLRETFNQRGGAWFDGSTSAENITAFALIGLVLLPFDRDLAMTCWTFPTLGAGLGLGLKALSRLGAPKGP